MYVIELDQAPRSHFHKCFLTKIRQYLFYEDFVQMKKTVPAQAVPAQAVPAQAVPAQAVPAQELVLSKQLFSPHQPNKYYNLLFCTYIYVLWGEDISVGIQ